MLLLGFAATGVGVALPGTLLPLLQSRWRLGDDQAGRLFLVSWIGSSIGALLVRGSLRTSLLVGAAAVAVASAGLAICESHAALLFMGLFGFGLGAAMTSISLIRQQQTGGSGTELIRLNLVWALGAFVCPLLTAHALAVAQSPPIFWLLSLCFAALAFGALLLPGIRLRRTLKLYQDDSAPAHLPFALIAMIFLVTGIEASTGGWLTTYTQRYDHRLAETIAAPTCFWAGLLLSRLFWSLRKDLATEVAIIRGSLLLMTVASILLIALRGDLSTLVASLLLGFGLGPTYPLLLGWALRLRAGGAIFFLAGVGSACLPWLTGLLSAQRSSLRLGLAVPVTGTLLMLLLAVASPLTQWSLAFRAENPSHPNPERSPGS